MADAPAIRLMIATHTHGSVTPAFAQSLATACGFLAMWGVPFAVGMYGDSDVSRGRNTAAAAFMAGDFTHLLFLDADIEFQAEDIWKLIKANRPLVVGAYRKKNERDEYAVSHDWDDRGRVVIDQSNGCIRIQRAGTGFMLIARQVFEAVRDRTPELAYVIRKHDGTQVPMHRFFSFELRNDPFPDLREEWSEDSMFCQRWRDCGGDVWLEPTIELGHWGPHCWRGNIMTHFRPVEAGADVASVAA